MGQKKKPKWLRRMLKAAHECETWYRTKGDATKVLDRDVMRYIYGEPWQNITGGMVPFRRSAAMTPGDHHEDYAAMNEIVFLQPDSRKVQVIREYDVTFLRVVDERDIDEIVDGRNGVRDDDDDDPRWIFTPFPSTGRIMFRRCVLEDDSDTPILEDHTGVLARALAIFQRTAKEFGVRTSSKVLDAESVANPLRRRRESRMIERKKRSGIAAEVSSSPASPDWHILQSISVPVGKAMGSWNKYRSCSVDGKERVVFYRCSNSGATSWNPPQLVEEESAS